MKAPAPRGARRAQRQPIIEILLDEYAESLAQRIAMRMLLSRSADIGGETLAADWERRVRNLKKLGPLQEVVAERVASLRQAIAARLAAEQIREQLAGAPDLPVF